MKTILYYCTYYKNIYRNTIANGLVGGGILFGNMYNNDVELFFFQREQHIARVKRSNRS